MNVLVVHPRKDAQSAGSKPAENRLLPEFGALRSGDSTISRIFSYIETETHGGTVCFGDTRASRNHAAATTVIKRADRAGLVNLWGDAGTWVADTWSGLNNTHFNGQLRYTVLRGAGATGP
jgi:hypothetical protein